MVRSIHAAVRQIKSDVAQFLSPRLIHEVCRTVGHVWRQRVLDPVTTVHLFALQILHGNMACPNVPRLGAVDCTGEAYCQARRRLPLAVLRYLLRTLSHGLNHGTALDDGRWHGHRTFLVDGSSCSMPDTPELQKAFGQPGAQMPGCGFPVMHLLALFHAATGYLLNISIAPLRTHDMSRVGQVHPDLNAGDILIGDRAFGSFVHLALLAKQGVFGLFRAHQRQIVDFRRHRLTASKRSRKRKQIGLPSSRWLKRLGRHDQLVEYRRPHRPKWMSEAAFVGLPDTLVVRELRYTVATRGHRARVITLVTTLLDARRYPKADVTALYGQRWSIETNFRHLKQTLRMDVLHCKTVDGVHKEVLMYAVVYNLIRLVMCEAARRQHVPVDRVSFVDAARWLVDAVHGVRELQLRIVPLRPGRLEPRAVKRRPKEYDRLNQPRHVLRKLLLNTDVAA